MQQRRAIGQRAQGGRQLGGQRIRLRQQARGVAIDQEPRVLGLVVIDRLRKRHQHAADADRAQFGQRQRTRATHDQIGPRVRLRHVGDEGLDARLHQGIGIGAHRIGMQGFATLVQHVEFDFTAQCGDRLRHGGVQGARALTAPKHQHAQWTGTRCEACIGRIDRSDFGAHRIADPLLAALDERVGEPGQQANGHPGKYAIGHARCAVLLMHQQWRAGHARRQPTRASSEAAKAHHGARLTRMDQRDGASHGAGHLERGEQQCLQTFATHAADRQRVEVNAVRRYQSRFHGAIGAEPCHRHAPRAQGMRHRKSGENMPTRAAGEDHHRTQVGSDRHRARHGPRPNVGSTRECRRLVPRAVFTAVASTEARRASGRTCSADSVGSPATPPVPASPRNRAT